MIIVWHYRDLRLEDNLALTFAANSGLEVLPLYIHDPDAEEDWTSGGASNWWLHHSLEDLQKRYEAAGSRLIIRQGDSRKIIEQLADENPIESVVWTKRYQPNLLKRDEQICQWMTERHIDYSIFGGNYLVDPEYIRTTTGEPYKVFTPFSKIVMSDPDWGSPLPAPKLSKSNFSSSDPLENLNLLPKIAWDKGIRQTWKPGRKNALEQLKAFCRDHITTYDTGRDLLAEDLTSRLSPHLAFGEISPREVWQQCEKLKNAEPYLRQLVWREFGNSFLYHFPEATNISWRKEFEAFPWEDNADALSRWQRGKTGYPIVDAAMRQLWQTGWMHNRARMIVGSFLIKDLFLHWIHGARWFWDTLVDADLANNTLGWQWIAGSGPDAAPYFRIFNPILQGKKFDPEGKYVKQYVPELARIPAKWIHTPWEAPPEVLEYANVSFGDNYPERIVDHSEARKQALAGYEKVKTANR